MKNINHKKGFTLIEVIVSLTIIAIAIIPISLLYFKSMNVISRASNRTKALQHARSIMECIKSMPYKEIAVGSFIENKFKKCSPDFEEQGFKATIKISEVGIKMESLLSIKLENTIPVKKISVSVPLFESDKKSNSKSVELVCIVSKH